MYKLLLQLFLFYILSIGIAYAENTFEPSIKVGMGYSDNIDQDHSKEKNSFIAEVSPSFKFSKEGGRVKANLDYKLNSYAYSEDSVEDRTNLRNDLQANMQAELLEHSIFVDLDASITQERLNKREGNIANTETGSDNLTETYTYGINPYWKQKWSGYAESIVSYDYNEVQYDNENNLNNTNNLTNDSDQQKGQITIQNGSNLHRLLWKIDLKYSEVNYKDVEFDSLRSDGSRSQSALGILGYQYNSDLALFAKFGYEDYVQSNDLDSTDNNGSFSGAGFIWKPSTKTLLDVSAGSRFYGDAYDLTFEHQSGSLGFNLKYNESITSSRDEFRQNNSYFVDQLSVHPTVNSSINENVNGLYLSKKYDVNISYTLKRFDYRLSGYHDDRDFGEGKERVNEKVYGGDFSMTYHAKKSDYRFKTYYENRDSDQIIGGEQGKDLGVDLSWDLKIGKRMNSLTSITWLKQEYDAIDNETINSDEWKISWALSRKLSKSLSGDVRISHQERTSDRNYDEFVENTFFVNLNKSFR